MVCRALVQRFSNGWPYILGHEPPQNREDDDRNLQGGSIAVEPLPSDDVVEDHDLHRIDRVHDHEDADACLDEELGSRQVRDVHGAGP